MATKKRDLYRDAGSGRIISPDQAKRQNPKTWVKEKVSVPSKK